MKMYDGGYFHTFSPLILPFVPMSLPRCPPSFSQCKGGAPVSKIAKLGAFITPISRTGFCHRFISTQRSGKNNKLKKKHHIGKRSHQKSVPIWFPFLLHLAENLTLPSGNLPSGQGFTQLDSSRKSPPHRWNPRNQGRKRRWNFWGNHRETRGKT